MEAVPSVTKPFNPYLIPPSARIISIRNKLFSQEVFFSLRRFSPVIATIRMSGIAADVRFPRDKLRCGGPGRRPIMILRRECGTVNATEEICREYQTININPILSPCTMIRSSRTGGRRRERDTRSGAEVKLTDSEYLCGTVHQVKQRTLTRVYDLPCRPGSAPARLRSALTSSRAPGIKRRLSAGAAVASCQLLCSR